MQDITHFSQFGRITLCGKEVVSRQTGKSVSFSNRIDQITCQRCKERHAAREAKISASKETA